MVCSSRKSKIQCLEHIMLLSADKLYEILISNRTLHLPTGPELLTTGLLSRVLLCLVGQPTCLTWTPQRIYGILSRGRWETPDPTIEYRWAGGHYQCKLGSHNTSAVPQAFMPRHATPMQSFVQKYRVYTWTYFSVHCVKYHVHTKKLYLDDTILEHLHLCITYNWCESYIMLF